MRERQNRAYELVRIEDPYKVLLVGPGKAPDGDLVGRNLLLDTNYEDSRRTNARVSVHRCKRCYNPHEGE